MPVDEMCAQSPNKISDVTALSTSDGVEITWSDEPFNSPYTVLRRNVGTEEWIPLAYLRNTSGGFHYLDTLPRFGHSVEYLVRSDVTCEDADSPTKVTLAQENDPWDTTSCASWTTPVTDVTVVEIMPSWNGARLTWNDAENPPLGTQYFPYIRDDRTNDWYTEDSWSVSRRLPTDPLRTAIDLPEQFDPATTTFGITRGVVCDPETLDGATARAPEPPPTEPTTTAPEPPSPEPPRRPDPSDG